MQQPYAEAACVLKVNGNCQACKMKAMEVYGSVCGVYNIEVNAEEGLAKMQGVVEPNLFMKAMAGAGPHAEPKWVKIQHPKMHQSYYHNNYETNTYGSGYNHGSIGYDPYSHNYSNGYHGGAIGHSPYSHNYSNGYHGGAIGHSPFSHIYSNGYNYGAIADPYRQSMMEPHYSPYYHGSGHLPTSSYAPRRRGPFQY